MLDLRIAEISATAGAMNDGVVLGRVNQSLFTGTFNNAQTSDTVYAYRKDAGAGFNFVDISTSAVSGTTDACEPWGPTSTFSAGDALYVSCNQNIRELFVQVTTAGVWTGTGIEVLDSTDGKTPNRTLANVVDGSNGLRSTGVFRISWDTPATARVAFSPIPGDIAERKWVVIRPAGLTAVTTAPKLSRIWLIHDDASIHYTERTTVHNTDLSNGTFGTDVQFFPVVGSTFVMCLPNLAYGIDLTVHRKIGTTGVTRVPEYLASDDTWKSLQNFVDSSDYWRNGPTNLGDPTQSHTVRWSIPADWTSKTQTFTTSTSSVTVTGYFIRYRVTAVSPYGPVWPPLFRARVRAFGIDNASGLYHVSAKNYSAMTFECGRPPTTNMNLQLINANTGASASVTVPANTSSSGEVTGQRLDVSLSIGAGQSLLLAHSSGGSAQDVRVNLQ